MVCALGCTPQSEQDRQQADALHQEIATMLQQKVTVSDSLHALETQEAGLRGQVLGLQQDARVLQAEKDGRGVHYVLSVSIRQVSYSLSIRKQLRDAVNEETFDLPTDRVTYEHTNIGQDLFESFRAGSAIFHGSLGSWRLKVENKRVVTD